MAVKAKTKKRKTRAPRAARSPLLTMGEHRITPAGWTVVLANIPLYFSITKKIIARAVPGSPRYCVVALALEALFGRKYDFQVGKVYTKIWDRDQKIEVRFHTPASLRSRLSSFDKKDGWDLPPNVYKLNPLPDGDRDGSRNQKNLDNYHKNKGNKKRVVTKRRPSGGSVTITTLIKGGKKKPRAAYSRTVLRNTRIAWTPPSL